MGKSAKIFKAADARPEKRKRGGNPSILGVGVEKTSKHDARKHKEAKMDPFQKAIASAKSKRKGGKQ